MDPNWEGTTEAFASYSAHWLRQKNLLLKEQEPTIRLVRDYVARGILTKPERRGKEVIFSYTQLVQFLACRALTNDGWPLKKIADDFSKASFFEILSLVPEGQPEDKAIGLINSFKKKMGSFSNNRPSKPLSADTPSAPSSSSKDSRAFMRRSESNSAFYDMVRRMEGKKTKPKPRDFQYENDPDLTPQTSDGLPPPNSSEPFRENNFHSRMRNQHMEREELTRTLRKLNAPHSSVKRNQFTDFTITPGTRFQMDNFSLSNMTRDKAKAIAKVIELTLIQNLKFKEGE